MASFFSYKKSVPVKYLIKNKICNSPNLALFVTVAVSTVMLCAAGAITVHAMSQQSAVKFVAKYQPIDQRAYRATAGAANKN